MVITKLWVCIDNTQQKGIGIKSVTKVEVDISDKSYHRKGFRLRLADFGKPEKSIGSRELGYYIWVNEESTQESIRKCIDLLISDFEKMENEFNETKEGVLKIKNYLKK